MSSVTTSAREESRSGPPGNVLVMLADDLGVDMVGAYGVGTDLPPTPTLDQMAGQGVVFENAWSNPYCSPTRATIQTGRYSFRTGIGVVIDPQSPSLPSSEVTIPEMLDIGTGSAYAVGAFGKWHLSNDTMDIVSGLPFDAASGGASNPNLQGYARYAGSLYNLQCGLPLCSYQWWQQAYPHDYFYWPKTVDGTQTMSTVYATTDTVDEALAWLATAPEPWMCYVAFHAPHAPFQAPPAHLNSSGLTPGEIAPGDPRPYYKAMVEALDTEIGRLLAGIDRDVMSRTTAFFLGDNGTPASVVEPPFDPSHAKGTVYQGGINVPFIVTGPLVAQPGSTSAALVDTTDLFATVADIAGVDLATALPDVTIDGVSITPYLADPALPSIRDFIYSEVFTPNVVLPHCQPDMGTGGPTSAQLSICGDPLFVGGAADLVVADLPPNAPTWIALSRFFSPLPFKGGTLGPVPLEALLGPVATDDQGQITIALTGGNTSAVGLDLYFQGLAPDGGAFGGWALTNTVRATWPSESTRVHNVAIRNKHFKLIRIFYQDATSATVYGPGIRWQLFDLRSDPLELVDLLNGAPLPPNQFTQLQDLQTKLDALLPAP